MKKDLHPVTALGAWVLAVIGVAVLALGVDQYPQIVLPIIALAVVVGMNVCRLPCQYIPARVGCEKCA